MSRPVLFCLSFLFAVTLTTGALVAQPVGPSADARARLLVLTDVENEPDDTESLVRLLVYSNVVDIEGLVATTSVHLKSRVSPESIHRLIDGYAKVRGNLLLHESGFPEAADLHAKVKRGLPIYGMNAVGEGRDSEGSDWIIAQLEKPDERPLWVTAWGGPNTLAQALYKLKATRSEAELRRLVAKLRVYTISDQDDSGPWMRRNFPDLFYIVSPGGYGAAAWVGIMHVEPSFDNTTVSNRWIAENIQRGHGPLGALYPDVAYGMEGDTPSWLALIPNGLSVPERPDWGGWGGRYELYTPALESLDPKGFNGGIPVEPETRPIWTNADDDYAPPVAGEFGVAKKPGERSVKSFRIPVWRWREDFQNDFAARMDWTVKSRAEANHPPLPLADRPEAFTVRSGEWVHIDAQQSQDPDGDGLSFWWFQYTEAGTYKERISLNGSQNICRTHFVAPQVQKPETVHVILKVTDKGEPALSRYKRFVITVTP